MINLLLLIFFVSSLGLICYLAIAEKYKTYSGLLWIYFIVAALCSGFILAAFLSVEEISLQLLFTIFLTGSGLFYFFGAKHITQSSLTEFEGYDSVTAAVKARNIQGWVPSLVRLLRILILLGLVWLSVWVIFFEKAG